MPKDQKNKKELSKELSRDNNILYSLKGEDSDTDDYTLNNSSLLIVSRFYTNFNINQLNNFRNKKNKDINDIESLIYRMQLKPEEIEKVRKIRHLLSGFITQFLGLN